MTGKEAKEKAIKSGKSWDWDLAERLFRQEYNLEQAVICHEEMVKAAAREKEEREKPK